MSKEIGLPEPAFVINKVKGPGDEEFARRGLAEAAASEGRPAPEIVGVIPDSDEIRASDRDGTAVIDAVSPALRAVFEGIADRLLEGRPVRQ
jgi:hypothetical protein